MENRPIQLAKVLGESRDFPYVDEDSIVKSRRIFVNRNLKMKSVRMIGFDMDHTLAVYDKAAIETLAFDATRDKLVHEKGYPHAFLDLRYDPCFVIRGLVVDKKRGNVVKMDKHKYVVTAYHGKRLMSRQERKATYAHEKLTIYDTDFRSIDTLFSLPEADLFAQIVDLIELGGAKCDIPYIQIFEDIRKCIDKAHQDGSIKSHVLAHPEKFFIKDPKLPLTLDKFIRGGKRLFLLTNSAMDYTERVMGHLLNSEMSQYPNWKDYFDSIIIDANKPGFFLQGTPLSPLESNATGPGSSANGSSSNGAPSTGNGRAANGHAGNGTGNGTGNGGSSGGINGGNGSRRYRVFRFGSSAQLETMLGVKGEEILYFGDHTYGDILRSKKSSGWRTVMVIEELEHEVDADERVHKIYEELDRLHELTSELRFQSNHLVEKVNLLRESKTQDYSSLGDEEIATIDQDTDKILRRVTRIEQKISQHLLRAKALEAQCEREYNPYWGQLFKGGRENSRFGDQVEDFACVYTSKVSNFLYYPVSKYFQTSRELMPHEV